MTLARIGFGALLLAAFAVWWFSDRRHRPDEEDDADDLHVYPTFGREHVASRACWCQPTNDEGEPHVLLHRVMS